MMSLFSLFDVKMNYTKSRCSVLKYTKKNILYEPFDKILDQRKPLKSKADHDSKSQSLERPALLKKKLFTLYFKRSFPFTFPP